MRLIGITQRVEVFKDRLERRDCLDQAWAKLLLKSRMIPVPLSNCFENVEKEVTALNLDGILLTGGNDLNFLENAKNKAPERDLFESELLSLCSKINLPVLGVCRGMQLMANHYGGTIIELNGHVATTHHINVHVQNVIPLKTGRIVNSFHNFGIDPNLLKQFKIVATSMEGYVEAMAHKKLKQWGIMWHPERPPFDETDVLLLKEIFQ